MALTFSRPSVCNRIRPYDMMNERRPGVGIGRARRQYDDDMRPTKTGYVFVDDCDVELNEVAAS